MWAVINNQLAGHLKEIPTGEEESRLLASRLEHLWGLGVFDEPIAKREEWSRLKIRDFIDSNK